jgi:acetoin utilization protein AcuB
VNAAEWLARRLLTPGSMLPHFVERLDACVADLMSRHPITVAPQESVEMAIGLVRTCRIRHLPVQVGHQVVGVVSVRDLLAAEPRATVKEVMSAPAQTSLPETPIAKAAERLLGKRISCLPVVEDGRLVGIFTATDALRFTVAALDEEANRIGRVPPVEQVMTGRPLTTVGPTATLGAAWRAMRAANLRHLPVTDGADSVVGILSDRDILASGRTFLDEAEHAGDGDDARAILVADAMSPRVITIDADRPAVEAARVLLRRRIGAVPVARHGALVGIVTVSDFLYWIVARA